MLEKLEAIYHRWKDVEAELSSPDAMADMKRFAQLNKEYKDLAKIVDQYHIYRNIISNIESNKEILATEKDEEFREMAKGELTGEQWFTQRFEIVLDRSIKAKFAEGRNDHELLLHIQSRRGEAYVRAGTWRYLGISVSKHQP